MPETNKQTILIVDDEDSVRTVLSRILEGAGYRTITASGGEEALSKVNARDLPVVLTDIKMPGMSGIELLSRLSSLYPDICAILVTAVNDTETAVDAMKLGAYDYIIKPFEPNTVIEKLRQAISRWNNRQEDKKRYQETREKFLLKTDLMQKQFNELVESLAREHKLIIELAGKGREDIKKALDTLPPELRKPINTVEEFRDALIRILRRT